jgi:lipopolysaccharide biosynthesis protein
MIMLGSSPEAYELWLAGIVEQTCARYGTEQRIVFINAWNEWAEGCHLEPDRRYGHQFLQATQRALGITGDSLGSPSGAGAKSAR